LWLRLSIPGSRKTAPLERNLLCYCPLNGWRICVAPCQLCPASPARPSCRPAQSVRFGVLPVFFFVNPTLANHPETWSGVETGGCRDCAVKQWVHGEILVNKQDNNQESEMLLGVVGLLGLHHKRSPKSQGDHLSELERATKAMAPKEPRMTPFRQQRSVGRSLVAPIPHRIPGRRKAGNFVGRGYFFLLDFFNPAPVPLLAYLY